jgi:hypothetical protein
MDEPSSARSPAVPGATTLHMSQSHIKHAGLEDVEK